MFTFLIVKTDPLHLFNHGLYGLQHLALHLTHFEIDVFDFLQNPLGFGVVIALALAMVPQLPIKV